jgi:fluoroacetyl-CoA thioesterase
VPLRPGLAATVELTVADADTAIALRSGSVPVLGTPRIVALCEEAACMAIQAELEPGQTTVGMRIQLDHVAPSAVGSTVKAEATLERVEGRRLTFTLSVNDSRGLVAVGRLTRVVVDADRFLEKAH